MDAERGNIVLDLGKGGSAVLPKNEQVPGEHFTEGQMVQVYVCLLYTAQNAQEPVRAFFFKADIPRSKVSACLLSLRLSLRFACWTGLGCAALGCAFWAGSVSYTHLQCALRKQRCHPW